MDSKIIYKVRRKKDGAFFVKRAYGGMNHHWSAKGGTIWKTIGALKLSKQGAAFRAVKASEVEIVKFELKETETFTLSELVSK